MTDSRRGDLSRGLFLAASASTGVLGSMQLVAADESTPAQAPSAAVPPIDPARAIAAFATGFDAGSLSPLAVQRANLAFIDSLGVMLAGSRSEPAHIMTEMVREEDAAPRTTIAGRSLKSSAQLAALANGVALHALDYDVTTTAGQPTAALFPALLAIAEGHHSTPAEVFAAYIIGFEVALRLLRACPSFTSKTGWHSTGTIGTIAAAVACAKLLKAKPEAIVEAIGISSSLAAGLAVNFGTMTKPLHAGSAARNGVMAAVLATRGFTGSAVALGGANGYYVDFFRDLDWSFAPFGDLGHRYDLVEIGFKVKPYACGGLAHTAIDAALAVRSMLGGHIDQIAEVRVGVTNQAAKYVSTSYPSTIERAKFSVPYVIATSFVNGTPRLSTFTDAAVADPRVKAFAAKISAAPDPEFATSVDPNPARIVAVLNDGKRVESLIKNPIGSTQVPMSKEQIEAKFLDCAVPTLDLVTARHTFATWQSLSTQASFASLWPVLHRPDAG
jgi:2-methylcitrate dehydratase PrpD